MKEYDLVVIGTGSAATTAAFTCREHKQKVAIIDERAFGGTCALRGCDPKKVLVGVAELVDKNRRMKNHGVEEENKINWKDLIDFKSTFTDPVPKNMEKSFEEAEISCYHGTASLKDEKHVEVGENVLQFKKLLIATGAMPRPLSFEGSQYIIHSDDFLELSSLPEEIAFIGGGFISFEFAHIAARAGAKVHIIQIDNHPLRNFETELVEKLVNHSKALGIKIHLNTSPKSIVKNGDQYTIQMKEGSETDKIDCNLVIHGAGRVPNIDKLNLEKGNISYSKKGIDVNEHLQSISNSRVYAAGDVSASKGLPLTPIAGMESKIVAHNLTHEEKKAGDYEVMPSIVFSIPSLTSLGLTADEAKEKGYDVKENTIDTTEWYTYKRTREPIAMIKIILDKNTEKLLGVHILGENAAELINYFAMMMKFDLPLDEVKNMIFAYPSSASNLSNLL